jgi:DNA-binding response OmpR family regulator
MNGVQLVERLREAGLQLPAILVTGNTVPVPQEKLAGLRIGKLLEKPFSMDDLSLALRRAIHPERRA